MLTERGLGLHQHHERERGLQQGQPCLHVRNGEGWESEQPKQKNKGQTINLRCLLDLIELEQCTDTWRSRFQRERSHVHAMMGWVFLKSRVVAHTAALVHDLHYARTRQTKEKTVHTHRILRRDLKHSLREKEELCALCFESIIAYMCFRGASNAWPSGERSK